MARRKRLEAWANEYLDRDFTSFRSADEARRWAAHYGKAERLAVRLVECGPDEVVVPKAAAAVVRAAVRWHNNPKTWQDLASAVERMQKGRRK